MTGTIDTDTCLLPGIIADGVCQEAACHLDSDVPLGYSDRLAEHAEAVYQANGRWAKMIREGRGNAPRDLLYAFMRHWLAGLFHAEHPDLLARLPKSFCVGHEIV